MIVDRPLRSPADQTPAEEALARLGRAYSYNLAPLGADSIQHALDIGLPIYLAARTLRAVAPRSKGR